MSGVGDSIGTRLGYRAIISDLHFGDGKKLESFRSDETFVQFLDFLAEKGAGSGAHAELIINGDFIDFLQVEPLQAGPWRDAIGKLDAVFAAHKVVFDALGEFLGNGHRVVVLAGNHDIELSIGEVQQHFIALLTKNDYRAAGVEFPNEAPLGDHFRGWPRGPFVYRAPGLYVEHGNQFDLLNSFDHARFYSSPSKDRIALPWGSRFVFEVFNDAAKEHHYIDKLRPRAAALLLLYTLAPELVRSRVSLLARLGPGLFEQLRRHATQRRDQGAGGARSGNTDHVITADEMVLDLFADLADELEIVDAGALALQATGAGSKGAISDRLWRARAKILKVVLSWLATFGESIHEPDTYVDHAMTVARRDGARVIVFGHSHVRKDITREGIHYLNSGTWMPIFELAREVLDGADTRDYWDLVARLLRPELMKQASVLTFVEVTYRDGAPVARLCVWGDGAASEAR